MRIMPHRAGYFALAYSWDHHCEDLLKSLRAGVEKVRVELNDSMRDGASTAEPLLNYYKKWHYNRELYDHLLETVGRKIFTIHSLGYRGYGVNRDLAEALGAVEQSERESLGRLLDETFLRKVDAVRGLIYFPRECVEERRSEYIVTELCNKMGLSPEGQTPHVLIQKGLNLDQYFRTMSSETSWQANTAIFQRLFLKMGSSSATLMTGSTGLHNRRSPVELKVIGNRNFRAMYRYAFETLHAFTPIGLDLLKQIHYLLSLGLDPEAGELRRIDFPDRNGVTFEFGNFEREMGDLSRVLSETAESFHDLPAFIRNLARSYYMFIAVHPFWDSNGRVGRAFLNQMFMKKGLPPVSFSDEDEIFALPRYGGAMDDMHRYIQARIMKGVADYYYERKKLESLGFLNRQVYNVFFDSGFTFSQVDQGVQKIEVQFDALVIDEGNPLAAVYRNRGRIVTPSDFALYNMAIYYGFSDNARGPWNHTTRLQHNFYIVERESEIGGVRIFDVGFVVEPGDADENRRYFNCSVAYEEGGLLFDNKGLNYRYRLER
jgi:fido (protein-threonine AMPylation protein)